MFVIYMFINNADLTPFPHSASLKLSDGENNINNPAEKIRGKLIFTIVHE